MRTTRITLAAMGIGALAYGVWRLLGHTSAAQLVVYAGWLAAAVLLHDLVLAPGIELVGRVGRGRPALQGALVVAGLVLSVGALVLWRSTARHDPALALLQQDYGLHLLLLLGLVAGVAALTRLVPRLRRRTSRLSRRA
ncbi:hypothetical protein PZ938_04000 [Luteipulveratus sp. YIM 133132]|uniref:hypothetical protein n=1 Tax=Luteipulveratus flavus TaxID=3031728 RepID=UPI0023B155C6|nr:hypothetical protein [Luteipulveratus sp. YIM 133132]MDE9364756.1 hypothetical protein [Luteipulveratus sp. YIM 133132]